MNKKISKKSYATEGNDFLSMIQTVSDTSRGAGSAEMAEEKSRSILQKLSSALDCTELQAVLFSIFFNLSFENSTITITELASFIKCPPIQMAKHTVDLEELTKKKLLRKDRGEKFRYRSRNDLPKYYVPSSHLEAICTGQNIPQASPELESVEELLTMADSIFESIQDQNTGSDEITFEIKALLTQNKQLKFAGILLNKKLQDESLLIVVKMAVSLMRGNEEINLEKILRQLFTETGQQINLRRRFKRGDHELLRKNLVNFEPASFKSEFLMRLNNEFTNKLFAGESELLESGKGGQDAQLILHEIIHEKQLFYTEEEARNLSFLEESLMPMNFRKLENRLKEKGLGQGVSILFYGPPGTGKTETVYQLARKTGRDIRQIDISETKSMWFGESEKIIKKKFDQYRSLVKTCKIAPILLFNEADGIFGKRKDTTTSNLGQTENAIQNIILQEMELLNGIMIATTNMAGNLDKAFERRFLYKIHFDRPDMLARCMIWETRLPTLSSDFIRHLAENFELTGGQIDNIVRKYTMHQIIKDEEPGFKDIIQWCREENLKVEYDRVGFRI